MSYCAVFSTLVRSSVIHTVTRSNRPPTLTHMTRCAAGDWESSQYAFRSFDPGEVLESVPNSRQVLGLNTLLRCPKLPATAKATTCLMLRTTLPLLHVLAGAMAAVMTGGSIWDAPLVPADVTGEPPVNPLRPVRCTDMPYSAAGWPSRATRCRR